MGPRSTSRSTSDGGALVVGQIRGPHGIRGDVRVEPRTDVTGRFKRGAVFECDGVGTLRIATVRGETSSPIVRFAGYDSRDAALTLRDRFLRVPREESRRATKGAYLWADLVGLAAETADGTPLGTVRDLIRAGETDILIVVDESGRETLHPMLESVVRGVDLDAGRIVLAPQEEMG
jgi:16S rRNA processing protein RimM